MKPIRLRFSGLQSYRDDQEINFEKLGSTGIFGVFGPTGAGKSTVLDAITLALFGRVERAKSGTRGIMNQFENKLLVSFEFSLGEDRYLAERLYVKDKRDPDSVQNKTARLLKLLAETVVLADRANDMNSKIEELLGMSCEDFSRAVILPQGKFDQFLKLTGSDRARMLENIFGLERYGENLWKRAVHLENLLQQELQTNQKLMIQLGDASAEAVKQAEENLELKSKTAKEKKGALKQAESALKELEQLAGIYEEITALEADQEILKSKKPDLERDEIRLERAKKAEPMRNLLHQVTELLTREQEEADKLTAQENKARQIKNRRKETEARLTKAREGEKELNRLKEEELPRVTLALDYEEQAAKLAEELSGIRQNIEGNRKELARLAAQGKAKGDLLARVHAEILELNCKRRALSGVLEYRSEIEKAATALVDLEKMEEQEAEARNTMETRIRAWLGEESKLRQVLAENMQPPTGDPQKDNLPHLLELVRGIGQKADDRLNMAETHLEQVMVGNMAGALAEKLTAGESCPVCGSIDHPCPAVKATMDEEGAAQAKEKAIRAKKELARLQGWEKQVGLLYNTYRNIENEITTVHRPSLEAKSRVLNEARKRLMIELAALAKKFPASVENIGLPSPDRDNIRSMKGTLEKADSENKLLNDKMESRKKAANELESEIAGQREKYAQVKADLGNWQVNAAARENKITELRSKVQEVTRGIPATDFGQRVRKRIATFQKELTEAQLAWESVAKEEQGANNLLVALQAGLEKTKEHLAGVRRNLEQYMSREGFGDIAEIQAALLDESTKGKIQQHLDDYGKAVNRVAVRLKELQDKVKNLPFERQQLEQARETLENIKQEHEEAVREEGSMKKQLTDLQEKKGQWDNLQQENVSLNHRKELVAQLVSLLKGRKFVQFLSEEHLRDMAVEASVRLGVLTGQRYALELDEGCNFVMRDDFNGGLRRPVNTLSGGETFLTSLALALALSSKLQLKGQFPLGFFFLDEGFGTLDPEKLETVMNTLERLHDSQRLVGIITHVPELRNRMPRYIEVISAQQDGTGSRLVMRSS